MGNTNKKASTNDNTNANSQKKEEVIKEITLDKQIDNIAANYILTSSFSDLTQLAKLDYCNKIIVLTSKALINNLNKKTIKYLESRIEKGHSKAVEQSVVFISPNLSNKYKINEKTKQKICINISKFYIKIAHLFSAIALTTISKSDLVNNLNTVILNSKSDTSSTAMQNNNAPIEGPKNDSMYGGSEDDYNYSTLCQRRINALKIKSDFSPNKANNKSVTIEPNFCNINVKNDYTDSNNPIMNLYDEQGIAQLEQLYMDVYNDKTNSFDDMSTDMRVQYEKDLADLHKIFTGRSIPVDENGEKIVKKFKDINLKNFHDSLTCKDDNLKKEYRGSLKQTLYSQYVNHVKTMKINAKANQDKLLNILNSIFQSYRIDNNSDEFIIINPELTIENVDKLIETTRKTIINLYISCENDFEKGIKIFNQIIDLQKLKVEDKRLNNINIK